MLHHVVEVAYMRCQLVCVLGSSHPESSVTLMGPHEELGISHECNFLKMFHYKLNPVVLTDEDM